MFLYLLKDFQELSHQVLKTCLTCLRQIMWHLFYTVTSFLLPVQFINLRKVRKAKKKRRKALLSQKEDKQKLHKSVCEIIIKSCSLPECSLAQKESTLK